MLTSTFVRSRMLLFATIVALSSVRCAHTQRTPQQEECRRQVDRCMERCGDEPRRAEIDPQDQGCNDTQTPCEDSCYDDCL